MPPPWNKVPPTEPTPRFGYFTMPPAGCGYYSVKDLILGQERDNPPFYPYRGVFYDNDFRYLDDPANTSEDLFDPLKRIHLGDNVRPGVLDLRSTP